MSAPVNIDQSSFDTEVKQHDGLVLVDFWAPWCGPCKLIGPVLEELAGEYESQVKIAKVNVDENQSLAGQYGVRSIPTLLFYKGGEVVDQVIGAQPKEKPELEQGGVTDPRPGVGRLWALLVPNLVVNIIYIMRHCLCGAIGPRPASQSNADQSGRDFREDAPRPNALRRARAFARRPRP